MVLKVVANRQRPHGARFQTAPADPRDRYLTASAALAIGRRRPRQSPRARRGTAPRARRERSRCPPRACLRTAAARQRARDHLEVGTRRRRTQESVGSTAPPSVALGQLKAADALLAGAVEVGVVLVASLRGRLRASCRRADAWNGCRTPASVRRRRGRDPRCARCPPSACSTAVRRHSPSPRSRPPPRRRSRRGYRGCKSSR